MPLLVPDDLVKDYELNICIVAVHLPRALMDPTLQARSEASSALAASEALAVSSLAAAIQQAASAEERSLESSAALEAASASADQWQRR